MVTRAQLGLEVWGFLPFVGRWEENVRPFCFRLAFSAGFHSKCRGRAQGEKGFLFIQD